MLYELIAQAAGGRNWPNHPGFCSGLRREGSVSSDVLHARVRLRAITDAAAWVLAFALAFLMPGRVHQDIASDPSGGIASNNSAARPQPRVTGQAGAGVDA